jgi:hypothetical protein
MCFGSFRFKPKIFFVCFEDTLVEPRAGDPHCFYADLDPDQDPAQNLDADPDPDPGGGGVGQPKMCIPPGKILGTPLSRLVIVFFINMLEYCRSRNETAAAPQAGEKPCVFFYCLRKCLQRQKESSQH